MKKIVLLLSLSFLFTSCVTPMKPVDQSAPFDTEIGFKIHPPPNGPWYRVRTPDDTGYVLGREKSELDKKEGSTVMTEVRFGFINLKELNLKKPKDVFKFFEDSMTDKSNTDRFENMKSDFKATKFKNADCMTFDQEGKDKITKSLQGEKMAMSYRGLLCLHPKDQGRYIRMSLSQRVPVSRKLMDLSSDEKIFYNSLVFTELNGK